MAEEEMQMIAQLIDRAITHRSDEGELSEVSEVVDHLAKTFPIYEGLS